MRKSYSVDWPENFDCWNVVTAKSRFSSQQADRALLIWSWMKSCLNEWLIFLYARFCAHDLDGTDWLARTENRPTSALPLINDVMIFQIIFSYYLSLQVNSNNQHYSCSLLLFWMLSAHKLIESNHSINYKLETDLLYYLNQFNSEIRSS